MKAQLFSILAAAALLLCMTGCSKDEATPSNTTKLTEQDLVGLWWDEFEYTDVTETGQPFTRALLAVKADADHTGCIYLGVFNDNDDEPVAVYGGPKDAGFTWTLLPNGRVQIAEAAAVATKAVTRADGSSYGSQTTDVASTQLACAPEKLTMTNGSRSYALAKADAEQAAAIEKKLNDFNTNANDVEVIGIGEPNAPAGVKNAGEWNDIWSD